MRNLIFALKFLTRLPLPGSSPAGPDTLAAAAKWFPLVGLVIGALLAAAHTLGTRVDPWLGALLATILWIAITGGLHLDGLADLADALGGAHRDPAKLLAIMRDPHTGVFGMIALWTILSAKLVLLMLLARQPDALWALLLIPAWARLGPLIWSQSLQPLREGLGQHCAHTPQWAFWLIWLALFGAASWYRTPGLLFAPLVLAVWWLFLKHRVGGMNGDCLGAGVEISEALLLGLALLQP
ncbi:MAG: adenosylcobinamide-GDP ribazoletransferase [Burkholderiales bacterium]|nr:adenosylcobinamide-GDP ribazoletransferase [Burkholderiales bacterium]